MFATLPYGPSGRSLQLTLVPEVITCIDDHFLRFQLPLTRFEACSNIAPDRKPGFVAAHECNA